MYKDNIPRSCTMKYLIFGLLLFFAACSSIPCQDANAETGEGIFNRKCIHCHTAVPGKIENYPRFSPHREKLTDCEMQALGEYFAKCDSVKH